MPLVFTPAHISLKLAIFHSGGVISLINAEFPTLPELGEISQMSLLSVFSTNIWKSPRGHISCAVRSLGHVSVKDLESQCDTYLNHLMRE